MLIRRKYLSTSVYRLIVLAVILVSWEVSKYFINPIFVAPPSAIVDTLVKSHVEIAGHTVITFSEMLSGYALAITWGVLLGYIFASHKTLEKTLDPFLVAYYTIPIIALAPVFILAFGIRESSKVYLAAIYAGFPILINTIVGVKNIDTTLMLAVKSLGFRGTELFLKLTLPASLPYVVVGLRLGAVFALIAVIVGEFVASQAGLGWLVSYSSGAFQTARMYAGIIVLGIIGISVSELLRRIETYFMKWRYIR